MNDHTASPLVGPVNAEVRPDLATLVARFGAALHAAGLPVGPDRCERFARAITLLRPTTVAQLRSCATATLLSAPEHLDAFDQVFALVFTTTPPGVSAVSAHVSSASTDMSSASDHIPSASADIPSARADVSNARSGNVGTPAAVPSAATTGRPGPDPPDAATRTRSDAAPRGAASAEERLAHRDFAELTPDELARLATLMRQLTMATPPRRSHRQRPDPYGRRVDLRGTLRQARRTGGHPLRLRRRSRREKPRRLVVLCDISGSMEPYARAMLQLLYCAAGTKAEVFVFATRLTRLTRVLARSRPQDALDRAGRTAPDWSGGTRIGAALREFNDRYGRRGLARGAVVLIVSDGWDTGEPRLLAAQMARLSMVAHRVVWANPRTQSPRYRPLVAGMAAALPYCAIVVSAHNLAALPTLTAALAG